ncbi:YceI family protein [Burkholderia glumae]|uniref:YceI family protein n=1 Tax=Burkholderia glumae TaxID=337 RepID=UPI000F5D65B9|nr:YceI family protein [Burkholderia glumae]MCQ0032007.1 YceI family protein [Burkholderia glumae]MCQ0038918.1 YceI family protein [Burkholderia glumae]QJW78543.1 YceI family protein [Burkholderia glumae]RQZ74895.1 YceI family protein [Burkholderia glumae]UVS83386.1 YceI family protein [Burkholderia glumae]
MKIALHRSVLAAVAAAALAVSGSALAQMDLAKSKVSAVSKQMNVPTEGVFKKFSADLKFDPAKAAQGSARVSIDVASFDLGDKMYNDQVAGKEWFDAKAFPQASFVSSSIAPAGGNKYEVAGKLTIKGKTVPVTVPVTVTDSGATRVFDGVLPIKRSTFEIGTGEWKDTSIVADEVQIKFHLVAAK